MSIDARARRPDFDQSKCQWRFLDEPLSFEMHQ